MTLEPDPQAHRAAFVGVGLKTVHYDQVLSTRPAVSFFEVHAENYMMAAGPHHRYLEKICDHYALSLHGVGLSLGSADGLDRQHLNRLRRLCDTYRPLLLSEHLAWSVAGGHYLNDLLPLPLTGESLAIVADNVARAQDVLGRKILVENPSSYLAFKASEMGEVAFLSALVERTGCGLILDVNNVFVSGRNLGYDPAKFLLDFPLEHVGEVHLAGHLRRDVDGAELLIDDHGSLVSDEVWELFALVAQRRADVPVLVEWDNNIPALEILVGEAKKAADLIDSLGDATHG